MAAGDLKQVKTLHLEPPDPFISGVLSVAFAGAFHLAAGEGLPIPEKEGDWQLVFLQQGLVSLVHQDSRWTLGPNQALALSGEHSCTLMVQQMADVGVITLRGQVADQFMDENRRGSGLFFPGEGGAAWSVMAALQAEEDRRGSVSPTTCSDQAYHLLTRLYQKGGPPDSEQRQLPPLVALALGLIQREFPFLEGVGEVAHRLGVSQEHLTRQFRKYTGMSPGKYLNQVRVEYAKTLLQQGEHSISFVSDACGFAESNYFARVFRSFVGMSPREFAQSNLARGMLADNLPDSIYVI
jgi:AraC-like DNA-binding protein